jgi:NitT/TauT family transport system permease protein
MKNKFWENRLFTRIACLLGLALIWQGIANSGLVNRQLFPSLHIILVSLSQAVASGEINQAAGLSMVLIAKGLGIGFALAVLLATLGMASKIIDALVDTVTAVAHPLPGIALLPIIILWMGTGTEAILFIIVHSVLWPMLLNLMAGFKSIPKIYREVGANLELNPVQTTARLMIPASLPYLLAGLKIGWARAWRALISAEMIFGAVGGEGGLGWFIFKKRVFMDTVGIYEGIIVIVLIGIIVEDIVFHGIEQLTVKRWGMSV